MDNVLIFGESSEISKSMRSVLERRGFIVECLGRKTEPRINAEKLDISNIKNKILSSNFFVFNLGVLYPKKIGDQAEEEIIISLKVNLLYIIKCCEYIIGKNSKARIFIVGSESGKKGSFDTTYFLAKAALRAYVKEKQLESKDQQILLFSPSVISDAGMTIRRVDTDRLEKNEALHPKGRYLTVNEFTSIVSDFIFNSSTYVTNTEIEINGGKFARMQ